MSDEQETDAELLAGTVRGDTAAFARLVRRYIRSATLLAAQLRGDRDEAEDIVQDAFGVVYRQASTFDAARLFAPWFFAIVRRLALNSRAREARRDRLRRAWARDPAAEVGSRTVEEEVFARLDAATASLAMQELSPMQRACFELVVVRDLSIAEVAAMHGISESTVRQHVFRARAALRSVLDGSKQAAKNSENGPPAEGP